MKTALIAIVVAFLVGCASVASAQSASVGGGVNGFAAWQVARNDGSVDVYWAWVARGPAENEVRTVAYAGKTHCTSRAWDVFLFFCIDSHGRRDLRPLPSPIFNHDPLLGEALLSFSVRGEEHTVRWSATTASPSVDHSHFESGGSHTSNTRYYRDVISSGQLFGRTFKSTAKLRKLSSLSYEATLYAEE